MNAEELKILPIVFKRMEYIHSLGGDITYIADDAGTFADFYISWERGNDSYTYSQRFETHKYYEMLCCILEKLNDAIEFIKGCVGELEEPSVPKENEEDY